jgi:hypothetical protein
MTYTKNGTAITTFSMATKTSLEDKDSDEWVEKSQTAQRSRIRAGFAALTNRLVKALMSWSKGTSTRQYDKTIQVPNGNLVIERAIKVTAVGAQSQHDQNS